MAEIDAKDRHMLALLQDDARMPLVALARAVGLSRSAAQERLRRLERSVISRYTVRLAEMDAAPVARIWMAIRFAPGRNCAQIVPLLSPFPEIRVLHGVAGPVDLMALAEAATLDDLAALRERIAALPGIAEVQTTVVLATHLDRR